VRPCAGQGGRAGLAERGHFPRTPGATVIIWRGWRPRRLPEETLARCEVTILRADKRIRRLRSAARLAALSLAVFLPLGALADTVILTDGDELLGEVLSLDAEKLQLKDSYGKVLTVPRSRVRRIVFEATPPPLRVEVRIAAADDEADLLVNGAAVLERVAGLGSGWVDISEKLGGGNNQIRILVRNQRSGWAYRWELRVNGRVGVFSCGQIGIKGKGCACCGIDGAMTGEISAVDPVWLFVDRAAGTAEVVGR